MEQDFAHEPLHSAAHFQHAFLQHAFDLGRKIVNILENDVDALRHWAQVEGIFAAPEGAAALAAYRKLHDSLFFESDDTVVLFNTGSGLKYLDVIDRTGGGARTEQPASRQIGGIIGPY